MNIRTIELERCQSHEESVEREIYWIAPYRDIQGIRLLNVSDGGGDGMWGRKHSAESRKQMSRSHSFPNTHVRTDETRKRISESQKRIQRTKVANGDFVSMPGEKNGQSVLTEVQVLEILELLNQGVSATELAKTYTTNRAAISHIKTNRNWRHIDRTNYPNLPQEPILRRRWQGDPER